MKIAAIANQVQAIQYLLGRHDTYRLDVGRYPITDEGLAALLAAPATAGAKWNGSDIHLESAAAGLAIKYRVDGVIDHAAAVNGAVLAGRAGRRRP
ncbi:type II secretion system protein GspG [Janthinobacterium sp. CG_S6]|uniref:type II secretion system protein GspG n=1 Tax=unclassified Janthinobacterium TaxID=2610881 RepID=UPI000345944D|nr:type II secretory ATPase GspE/PulE/Tfp pilus assembly ATPase PilB-like protein [Janthinobacterium sp. CG_S6]